MNWEGEEGRSWEVCRGAEKAPRLGQPPALPPGRKGGSQRHAGPSGPFPRAERMSARVRTRLRFQHLGAAAVGATKRTRKSRSSSPPSPRRAAILPALTAVAGEREPAPEAGTRAAASLKVSPGHLHPSGDVARHTAVVSSQERTSPKDLCSARLKLPESKDQAPRRCPSRAPACGLCHWQAAPRRASSELKGTRPVVRTLPRCLTGKGYGLPRQMSATGWSC